MAGSSLYQDEDSPPITDINVTPFVDVALVLLVVFMVTAKLIAGRGVEIDKPKAATGGNFPSTLRVSVDKDGQLFVNGDKFTTDAAAIARVKEIAATVAKPRASIAGSRVGAYGNVMRAIDVVKKAGREAGSDIPIVLENERP